MRVRLIGRHFKARACPTFTAFLLAFPGVFLPGLRFTLDSERIAIKCGKNAAVVTEENNVDKYVCREGDRDIRPDIACVDYRE